MLSYSETRTRVCSTYGGSLEVSFCLSYPAWDVSHDATGSCILQVIILIPILFGLEQPSPGGCIRQSVQPTHILSPPVSYDAISSDSLLIVGAMRMSTIPRNSSCGVSGSLLCALFLWDNPGGPAAPSRSHYHSARYPGKAERTANERQCYGICVPSRCGDVMTVSVYESEAMLAVYSSITRVTLIM
jgi:hypothetical protein